MKKILLSILSIIIIVIIIHGSISNNKTNEVGKGTLKDPYYISNTLKITELEGVFKSFYIDLLEESENQFELDTDLYWINIDDKQTNNIIIDSIHYVGNQAQANMMIIITCEGIDKKFEKDILDRYRDEEIVITTSYDSIDIKSDKEIDTSKFKNENANKFALKLADDILNDHAKMIINYRLKYEENWYGLSTMIDVEHPNKLMIPKAKYGKGYFE